MSKAVDEYVEAVVNETGEERNAADTTGVEENLTRDIYLLQCAINEYECKIKSKRFRDVAESVKLPKCLLRSTCAKAPRVPDVTTILRGELYAHAGINCAKVGGEFVFYFPVVGNGIKELYSVQIINRDGVGWLGRWAMPTSVEMNAILEEEPIENINNIRNFIKTCKHHIDCYTCRQEQVIELRDELSGLKNCGVQTDLGYRRILLQLTGIREIATGKLYNMILYLFYESNETLPREIKQETVYNEQPWELKTMKAFQKYFNCFKKLPLKAAFAKVQSNTSVFEMKRLPKDEINVIDLVEEDEDQETVEFFQNIRKQGAGSGNAKENRRRSTSRESNFSDEDVAIGDKSAEVRQGPISNKSLEPKRRNARPKVRVNGGTKATAEIPGKTDSYARGKRKLLEKKEEIVDLTKSPRSANHPDKENLDMARRTIREVREENNNTPVSKFSGVSRKSRVPVKTNLFPPKSAAADHNVSDDREKTKTTTSATRESKILANRPSRVRKALNVVKNGDNPLAEDASKRRKSVRWQVECTGNIERQATHQNFLEGTNKFLNSTPVTERCQNRKYLPSCIDDISEIVRVDHTKSTDRANEDKPETEESFNESPWSSYSVGSSTDAEDHEGLLRDLNVIWEMKVSDGGKTIDSRKQKRKNMTKQ